MWPEFEVLDLEDTAFRRGRVLLQLPCRTVRTEQLLELGDLLLAEPVGADELADLLAGVVRSQRRLAPLAVPLRRDAKVLPPADVLKDVAAHVALVEPLHDGDHRILLGVVQSS